MLLLRENNLIYFFLKNNFGMSSGGVAFDMYLLFLEHASSMWFKKKACSYIGCYILLVV
jgi:hypothetical protein